MHPILQPVSAHAKWAPAGIVLLLVASAGCIFGAPLAMPADYSWLVLSISESAAQGLRHAWIARFGFLCFGLAVIWLSLDRRYTWARGTYWMQLVFGVCMLAVAAFSHKPWIAGVASDPFEDLLHSIAASGMGFAFSIGVLVRFLQRGRRDILPRVLDAAALLAATVITPIGGLAPGVAGLLQRVMFAVAYVWFVHEAVSVGKRSEVTT